MTQRLFIARHGNTFGPGDIIRRVGLRSDVPLVESGLEQGLKLGHWLKAHAITPAAIFTSQLQRTRQTAEKICEGLGLTVPIMALEWLNELDYGVDEGRPEADVMARLGPQLAAWEKHSVVPDGWSIDVEVLERHWADFGRQLHLNFSGQDVVVVTSGGVARFAPALLLDTGRFKREHPLKVATGALCEFVAEGGLWRCVSWNVRP